MMARAFATGVLVVLAGQAAGQIAPTPVWVRQFGTSGTDLARAALAAPGKVYVVGYIEGELGGPNAGSADVYLACLGSNGQMQWVRQFGSNSTDWVWAIESSGDLLYTAGRTHGRIGASYFGGDDAFLTCHDPVDGSTRWVRQFGAPDFEFATGLAADGDGGVYVVGSAEEETPPYWAASYDAFVMRFTSAGERLWATMLRTATDDFALDVSADDQGGVFVVGTTWGSLTGTSAGLAWVARLDRGGNTVWIQQFGPNWPTRAEGALHDGAGGVFISGKITENQVTRPFVARYGGDGQQVWLTLLYSGVDSGGAISLAPDGSGGVYVGWTDAFGSLRLGRVNSAGTVLGMTQLGPNGVGATGRIASDGLGGAYLTATTTGSLGGPSAGAYDSVVARYPAPAGACYVNCDLSTAAPVLNVADLTCFLRRFAAGEAYANCDDSTGMPVLSAADFICFLQRYAEGCW